MAEWPTKLHDRDDTSPVVAILEVFVVGHMLIWGERSLPSDNETISCGLTSGEARLSKLCSASACVCLHLRFSFATGARTWHKLTRSDVPLAVGV